MPSAPPISSLLFQRASTRTKCRHAWTKHHLAARSRAFHARSLGWRDHRWPGADPNPGTPMYICRARVQNSMVPGKWVQGNCNVPFGGSEGIMRSYEVAYGSARWGAYRGSTYGLDKWAETLTAASSIPAAFTTIASGTDYGYQPGKLVPNGTCHVPFGEGEVVQPPPFQVLYATGGGRPPVNPPYNPYPPLSVSTAVLSLSAAGPAVSGLQPVHSRRHQGPHIELVGRSRLLPQRRTGSNHGSQISPGPAASDLRATAPAISPRPQLCHLAARAKTLRPGRRRHQGRSRKRSQTRFAALHLPRPVQQQSLPRQVGPG